jgi:hypothetical protein
MCYFKDPCCYCCYKNLNVTGPTTNHQYCDCYYARIEKYNYCVILIIVLLCIVLSPVFLIGTLIALIIISVLILLTIIICRAVDLATS